MIEGAEEIHAYRSHFERLEESLAGEAGTWTQRLRKAAFEHFAEIGFPKTNQEEWRFTSMARLTATPFVPAEAVSAAAARKLLDRVSLPPWEGAEIVFVNGQHVPGLSKLPPLAPGAVIGSLREALHQSRDVVEPNLARNGDRENNPFAALNLGFLHDGAFVYLPDGLVLKEPVHLVFIAASDGVPTVCHPRHLIVASPGSQATIVESYVGMDAEVYFTNAVTEVVVGDNAVVDHYKVQRESRRAFHVATLRFRQGRNATLSTHSISLGAGLARNDIHAVLNGDGGDCTLNGLYLVRGKQHVDHHTVIDHARPHCGSRELYKGILDGASRAVFNGRIIVRRDAQKTDARQTNKNLLLSDEALVNTNPQLEINADDVKCTHGATIGQLDADALFYIRSRGIDEEEARGLLIRGFVSDITDRIRVEPIRTQLGSILEKELAARH